MPPSTTTILSHQDFCPYLIRRKLKPRGSKRCAQGQESQKPTMSPAQATGSTPPPTDVLQPHVHSWGRSLSRRPHGLRIWCPSCLLCKWDRCAPKWGRWSQAQTCLVSPRFANTVFFTNWRSVPTPRGAALSAPFFQQHLLPCVPVSHFSNSSNFRTSSLLLYLLQRSVVSDL